MNQRGIDVKYTRTTSSWQASAFVNPTLASDDDKRASLAREFNLPLPTGRYDRGADIIKAWEASDHE